jgi:predicted kinase
MQHEEYEVPDKDAGENIEPINQFSYYFVKGLIQDLQGKMLTLVDATVSDPIQRKASKDIARDHINTKLNWLFESAHFVEVDTDYPHEIIPIKKTK